MDAKREVLEKVKAIEVELEAVKQERDELREKESANIDEKKEMVAK